VARPSEFSQERAADICGRIASGEPLVKICRDESMPHVATVYRWIAANEAFRDMYARAREDQADTLADEIQAIADEPMLGQKTTTKANGDVETVSGDMIEHRKLRVDARKWIAAKLKPRKYGEKIDHQHGGNMTVRLENADAAA
jgi:hypothetical protein